MTTTPEQPSASASKSNGDDDDMLDDLKNVYKLAILTTSGEANLLHQCQVEKDAYLADQGLTFGKEQNKRECYDFLDWCKEKVNRYLVVIALVQIYSCAFLPVWLHQNGSEAGHHKLCH